MITLYARKEPTTCTITFALAHKKRKRDVVIYEDSKATQRKARIAWHEFRKPTRRNRYINLNCYRWRLEWLPDLEAAA